MSILFQIPFLELKDINVPVDRLLAEAQTLTDYMVQWYPPNVDVNSEVAQRQRGYKQLSFTHPDPSRDHTNLSEMIGNYFSVPPECRRFYTTNLARKMMPETLRFVSSITAQPIIGKLIEAPPGHALGWHCHERDDLIGYQSKPMCILHVPLVDSGDTVHWVSRDMPSDRTNTNYDEMSMRSNVWGKRFEVGKVYVFNSAYPHAVQNYSSSGSRLSLLLYNDYQNNDRMKDLLKSAIKHYEGPYINA